MGSIIGIQGGGVDSWWELGIFFSTMSRSALGPTQQLIQWVKQLGCEADHSPPSA